MMKGMIIMSNETTNKFSLIGLPDVPDSVDSAVKNLTDETTKNIGQTFGDLWYLVFGGIKMCIRDRFHMIRVCFLHTFNPYFIHTNQ